MELTQKDNLMIMPYINCMFILELKNKEFLKSEYYKNMDFQDKNIPRVFSEVGLDNQGLLLMTLYSLLVVPKELYDNELSTEFTGLNKKIKTIKTYEESNYSYDKNEINYVKHIRNAVSHANLRFEPNDYVEFIDTNKYSTKNEKCIIRIPLVKISELLEYLQGIFYRYISALKLNLF